jgi:serine/threonine-protein kinase
VRQDDQNEIIEAVVRELGKMGLQGTLAFAGPSLELRSTGGAPVSIDVGLIVEQWPLLPPEMRARKVEEMAQRLVSAAQISRRAEGRPLAVDTGSTGRMITGIVGFLVLLGVIGAARYLVPRLGEPDKPPPKPAGESDTARAQRLARACDAVRTQIYDRKPFGPLSLEGFAVELWLARPPGAAPGPIRESPAVTALRDGKKLAAASDDKLAAVIDGTLDLADGFDAGAAARVPGWDAVTVVFSEGYARAFFQEDLRPRFVGLAERVAAASGATHAALYARCAHLKTHDVGAWFRGPDLPGATAALVYQMGLFAEQRMIDPAALAAKVPAGAGEIAALAKAAADVEAAIPAIVGTAGGSVTPGKPASLAFSLAAPVRAVTAARDLSGKMGVGVP